MKNLFLLFASIVFSQLLSAQGLLDQIATEDTSTTYTTASYKATRVLLSHSLENTAKGEMEFKVMHRFGPMDEGFYDLFGLDYASTRLAFDFGITDRLMVGFGRSTYEKAYDGFFKYKIYRQSSGVKNHPISIHWVSTMAVNTLRWADDLDYLDFEHRLYYTHQALIGRKFNKNLTIQLTPTLVHRNLVRTPDIANNVWAIGTQGRYKFSKRASFNWDYYYVPQGQLDQGFYNTLTIGVDIETGGHVFQLMLTNSLASIEKGFITETTDQWKEGEIRLGFTISRVFNLKKS